MKTITIGITDDQDVWLHSHPKSFNISSFIRVLLSEAIAGSVPDDPECEDSEYLSIDDSFSDIPDQEDLA